MAQQKIIKLLLLQHARNQANSHNHSWDTPDFQEPCTKNSAQYYRPDKVMSGQFCKTSGHFFSEKQQNVHFLNKTRLINTSIQDDNILKAQRDMRYFARSKLARSLVHRKKFSLIRQVFFKLGYVFCQKS